VITNDAKFIREVRSTIAMAKTAFKKRRLFFQKIGHYLKDETGKVFNWFVALCGAGTWTIGRVNEKDLERFEMRCCRRMEKIGWTDRVRK
jgi:hypothetical protein